MSDPPLTPFDLVRMDVDGHPVLVVYGELDVVTSPKLHEAITTEINAKPSVLLVDMANVTFIDSTALGTLVAAHRHLTDAGGELRLAAVPPQVANVFQIAGLAERFQISPDMPVASEPTEVGEETNR